MDLLGLTEKVLQETMRQIKGTETEKKFLVLVTGGKWGIPQSVDFLEKCVSHGIRVSLVLSASAEDIMSRQEWFEKTGLVHIITSSSQIDMMKLLKEHEEIIVPILTINSAAKIAQGISDTLVTKLIFHGLLMGKKVTAARESCDLAFLSYYNQRDSSAAVGLEKLTSGYLEQLESLGIKFDTIDFLHRLGILKAPVSTKEQTSLAAQEISITQKLITESDITKLPNKSKVKLMNHSILTPSAKDMAKAKEIIFI